MSPHFTTKVDISAPTNVMTFPVNGGSYSSVTWPNGGCSAGTSRICGTAADTGSGVASSRVSIQRSSNSQWWNGSSWKSLFSRNHTKPTFIGYTSYGTIFDPQFKDEYPEISNIQAPANTLVVTHGGGYVGWFRLEYAQGGKTVSIGAPLLS